MSENQGVFRNNPSLFEKEGLATIPAQIQSDGPDVLTSIEHHQNHT